MKVSGYLYVAKLEASGPKKVHKTCKDLVLQMHIKSGLKEHQMVRIKSPQQKHTGESHSLCKEIFGGATKVLASHKLAA